MRIFGGSPLNTTSSNTNSPAPTVSSLALSPSVLDQNQPLPSPGLPLTPTTPTSATGSNFSGMSGPNGGGGGWLGRGAQAIGFGRSRSNSSLGRSDSNAGPGDLYREDTTSSLNSIGAASTNSSSASSITSAGGSAASGWSSNTTKGLGLNFNGGGGRPADLPPSSPGGPNSGQVIAPWNRPPKSSANSGVTSISGVTATDTMDYSQNYSQNYSGASSSSVSSSVGSPRSNGYYGSNSSAGGSGGGGGSVSSNSSGPSHSPNLPNSLSVTTSGQSDALAALTELDNLPLPFASSSMPTSAPTSTASSPALASPSPNKFGFNTGGGISSIHSTPTSGSSSTFTNGIGSPEALASVFKPTPLIPLGLGFFPSKNNNNNNNWINGTTPGTGTPIASINGAPPNAAAITNSLMSILNRPRSPSPGPSSNGASSATPTAGASSSSNGPYQDPMLMELLITQALVDMSSRTGLGDRERGRKAGIVSPSESGRSTPMSAGTNVSGRVFSSGAIGKGKGQQQQENWVMSWDQAEKLKKEHAKTLKRLTTLSHKLSLSLRVQSATRVLSMPSTPARSRPSSSASNGAYPFNHTNEEVPPLPNNPYAFSGADSGRDSPSTASTSRDSKFTNTTGTTKSKTTTAASTPFTSISSSSKDPDLDALAREVWALTVKEGELKQRVLRHYVGVLAWGLKNKEDAIKTIASNPELMGRSSPHQPNGINGIQEKSPPSDGSPLLSKGLPGSVDPATHARLKNDLAAAKAELAKSKSEMERVMITEVERTEANGAREIEGLRRTVEDLEEALKQKDLDRERDDEDEYARKELERERAEERHQIALVIRGRISGLKNRLVANGIDGMVGSMEIDLRDPGLDEDLMDDEDLSSWVDQRLDLWMGRVENALDASTRSLKLATAKNSGDVTQYQEQLSKMTQERDSLRRSAEESRTAVSNMERRLRESDARLKYAEEQLEELEQVKTDSNSSQREVQDLRDAIRQRDRKLEDMSRAMDDMWSSLPNDATREMGNVGRSRSGSKSSPPSDFAGFKHAVTEHISKMSQERDYARRNADESSAAVERLERRIQESEQRLAESELELHETKSRQTNSEGSREELDSLRAALQERDRKMESSNRALKELWTTLPSNTSDRLGLSESSDISAFKEAFANNMRSFKPKGNFLSDLANTPKFSIEDLCHRVAATLSAEKLLADRLVTLERNAGANYTNEGILRTKLQEAEEETSSYKKQIEELEERLQAAMNKEIQSLETILQLQEGNAAAGGGGGGGLLHEGGRSSRQRSRSPAFRRPDPQIQTLEAERAKLQEEIENLKNGGSGSAGDDDLVNELEQELRDTRDALDRAEDELDMVRSNEKQKWMKLMNEFAVLQEEATSLRTQLRAEQRKNRK